MPKTRIQATAADYVNIVATIPCHYLKVYLKGDRNAVSLLYKTPDDSFTAVLETDATSGDIIERVGHGRNGFLGVPEDFARSDQAATIMLKVKCSDSSVKDLIIEENENPL